MLATAPPCAQAFFEEFFGGGGGGGNMQFQQQQQQQVKAPQFPKGVPDSISKSMSWLKGTEWQWNRDGFTVKLQPDGDVDAPIQQCRGGRCKWSAEKGKMHLLMGAAGLYTMAADDTRPKNLKGMKLTGREAGGSQKKLSLTFEKVYDHDAADLDKDLYGALGLSADATEVELKKTYRKLSIKYHPDKNPDEASRDKFAEVRDAYEILSDPDKKILYDTGGMEAVKKADKGQIEKTDDFESTLEISLDELYMGGEKQGQINRRIVCRGCRVKPNAPQCAACTRCPNEVKVVNVQMGPFMTQQQQEVPSKEKCKKVDATIDMSIERGMLDGDKLTFPRMADERPGMIPGSVNLKLKMIKHPKFERRANDLHMGLKVTLREALLGWTQTVRHIDGHTVEVATTDVTKHLQVIRVAGEGMPLRDDPSSYGDLLVKVEVVFPKTLDAQQKLALEGIFPVPRPRTEL